MLNLFLQTAPPNRGTTIFSTFRHLGALGLFFLAIIDSSPVPTFGGPDILIAILVATRRNPWYEYATIATVGSIIGAYFTFRIARKAGEAYLDSKFGKSKVSRFLKVFEKGGTGTLVASTAIPFPFPTSMIFAAAGASTYPLGKFISVVSISRAFRYTLIAFLTHTYGRHLVRVFLHPTQYWGWFSLFTAIIVLLIAGGIRFHGRLTPAPSR
jgi:membrane protein YqaA with SNARE-associated domain